MNMFNPRKLFLSAACFNFLVAIPSLLGMELVAKVLLLDLSSPITVLFFQITMGIVALFGWAYYRIACDSNRYRPFILLGAMAKTIFVVVIIGHWIAGDLQWPLAALVIVDVIYAALFSLYYRRTA